MDAVLSVYCCPLYAFISNIVEVPQHNTTLKTKAKTKTTMMIICLRHHSVSLSSPHHSRDQVAAAERHFVGAIGRRRRLDKLRREALEAQAARALGSKKPTRGIAPGISETAAKAKSSDVARGERIGTKRKADSSVTSASTNGNGDRMTIKVKIEKLQGEGGLDEGDEGDGEGGGGLMAEFADTFGAPPPVITDSVAMGGEEMGSGMDATPKATESAPAGDPTEGQSKAVAAVKTVKIVWG